MKPKNFGLVLEPIQPTDFVLGSNQSLEAKYGAQVINPSGDWSDYTPSTENQDTSTGDTFACVSFGTTNAVEMLAKLSFKDSKNLSDRFLAKISGTLPAYGNSPKKVADTLRHSWTVDEPEWPDTGTLEEYYKDIPKNLKTLAVARAAEFEFGYQYITNSLAVIKETLKRSPVAAAFTAWKEENGVYVRIPGIVENHFAVIIKVYDDGLYKVFDSFPPYIKKVRPDAAKSVAMSYYLNRQVVKDSAFKKFLKLILSLFKAPSPNTLPVKPEPVVTPPAPAVPPAPSHLAIFCEAIKIHEGWFPGSRSWRNNNPGNARYSSVGYLDIYKPVFKDPQGFAIFKDYATGWLYLQNLVREYVRKHPTWTLLEFFETYAPAEDHNDPTAYAAAVGKRLGVDYKTFVISNLV